ncbi:hypothetical protein [Mesorhizobium sp. SP-1A]|uniref:hypothetical protein n=1 Tax=Mesorhizobium sp. SP-1A TaxID=3077840 RepID=UPI0028F6E66C|nr:hypothetical protein [Mesorhizobium sp. SP-1A]
MAYDTEEVLEAFGFEKKGDAWRFDREIREGDQAERAVVIVKIEEDGAMTGKVPMHGTYDSDEAVNFNAAGLYYTSGDVADMIALAQNEVGNSTMQVTGTASDTGFGSVTGEFWVTSPFNGDPWADYDLVSAEEVSGGRKMVLKNPQENFPEYDRWKAELVEQLMTPQAPKP